MKKNTVLSLWCFALFVSCTPVGEHHDEWKKYFDEYGVTGCFDLYDMKNEKFIDYNPDRCHQRFIPASTFKIFNSLVALQTGVAPDENLILKWDSVVRRVDSWNHDQDMKEAIKNSTVWYYQELARRAGESNMQRYLEAAHYGNGVIGGAIDSFWLNGGVRISCDEQIEFLKDFYHQSLPFSKRNLDIVKKIILLDSTASYKLYGKTGWGRMKKEATDQSEVNIGWFVGFVEKGNEVFFFATNIESPEAEVENFAIARKEITFSILRELKII